MFMILNGEITESGFATMSQIYVEMHRTQVTCVVQDSDLAHRSALMRKEDRSRCCSQHPCKPTP